MSAHLFTPRHLLFVLFFTGALAAPVPIQIPRDGDNTASVALLSSAQVDAFAPHALFAQAAYCENATAALPNVEILLAGGDGGLTPRFLVAHDPSSKSIVVAHEGTESDNILSIINDAEFATVPLDSEFFPNANKDIKTHQGFALTFARTAQNILSVVTKGLADKNVTNVIVTGHSLGAALAVMTSVFLNQQLAVSSTKTINLQTVVFGLPRGGNEEWAAFVDVNIKNLVHMHNQQDPVPTVPPRILGYEHPSGELFIQPDGVSVVSCPGEENENCSAGNKLEDVSLADHSGPYIGVLMGRSACPVL